MKYFSTLKEKFHSSIKEAMFQVLSIIWILSKYQGNTKPFHFKYFLQSFSRLLEQRQGLLCNHCKGDLFTCEENPNTVVVHIIIPCNVKKAIKKAYTCDTGIPLLPIIRHMASNRETCGTVFFLFICNFITPCNWHVIQDPGNDRKQVLLMLELKTGQFFHIIFVNDRGCMHKKIMHLKKKIIQIFPEGGNMINDFFCRYSKTLFSD